MSEPEPTRNPKQKSVFCELVEKQNKSRKEENLKAIAHKKPKIYERFCLVKSKQIEETRERKEDSDENKSTALTKSANRREKPMKVERVNLWEKTI